MVEHVPGIDAESQAVAPIARRASKRTTWAAHSSAASTAWATRPVFDSTKSAGRPARSPVLSLAALLRAEAESLCQTQVQREVIGTCEGVDRYERVGGSRRRIVVAHYGRRRAGAGCIGREGWPIVQQGIAVHVLSHYDVV